MGSFLKRLIPLAALSLLGALVAVAAKTPRPLLDVTIDGTNGARYRPAEGKGKVRVIAIFSNGCVHCEKAVAALNRVNSQYKPRGVQFFGALGAPGSRSELPAFTAKTHPNFPVGTLSKENTMRLADIGEKERPFVPILMYVDKSNNIVFQFSGEDQELVTQDALIKGMIDRILQDQK